MALGPLMLDIEGVSLSTEDSLLLCDPVVGGVILFSRNYESPVQLTQLCDEIHALRTPRLLIAVDQEGGRVQRFREGFSALPTAMSYGQMHDTHPVAALEMAGNAGWLTASELLASGLDLNFMPVMDLHWGHSVIIGDRAFHRQPDVVTRLSQAMKRGMAQAGMQAVGKHFPGHGWVKEDSHQELPLDSRALVDLELEDLLPFERLIHSGLAGIMTAHLQIPAVDEQAVSFSKRWISHILRHQLGFQGAIFSDDLAMHGAYAAGSPVERATQALAAGCDMILYCNDRPGASQIVAGLEKDADPLRSARLIRLHGQASQSWSQLRADPDYARIQSELAGLIATPELDLRDDPSG